MKMTKKRVRPNNFSHQQTLFFLIWPKFTTPTNINAKKICWCGLFGQVPQPWLASLHLLGHLPSLASLLYKKKTLGTDIRRTPDVKLRFVGFKRFVGFIFGQIQLLRLVFVMVRSNSFGHLDSFKWITLKINHPK